MRAGRTDLNDALKEGGRNDSAVGVRTRRLLIVCEVALSVVLLMGAAVMVRSLLALRHVDAGFNSTNVLTLRVSPPDARYDTPAKFLAFFDTALARIRALPGVQSAGGIDDLPTRGGSQQPIVLEGRPELLPRDQPTVAVRKITRGYLQTMQIPILRGRDVAENDAEVMLVSRSAAKLLWGEGDPIGRRVTLPLQSRTLSKEVIGIVGDVKQDNLSDPAAPSVYEFTRDQSWGTLTLVVRSTVPPMSLADDAAAVVRAIDPEQPVEDIKTMDAVLDETLTSQRFSALLLGLFAAVALTLASVGIYSVLVLHRPRPQSRDRHPNGARCSHGGRGTAGHHRRHDTGADRHRRRRGCGGRLGDAAAEDRVRRERLRSGDARGGGRRLDGGRTHCDRRPGLSRIAHRSAGRVARRLGPGGTVTSLVSAPAGGFRGACRHGHRCTGLPAHAHAGSGNPIRPWH